MKTRKLVSFAVLGTAAIAATAAACAEPLIGAVRAEPLIGAALPTPPLPARAAKPTAPRGDAAPYVIRLSIKKDGKTISAPTVITLAGEPVNVQAYTTRPFVIGIDKCGKSIVQTIDEGLTTNLTVMEGRDGIATLDLTMNVSQIEDVGRRGAVQTVKSTTQQVRVIEPVLVGGSISAKASDGTEITAMLEKFEEEKPKEVDAKE
jgi:hypothetical protein